MRLLEPTNYRLADGGKRSKYPQVEWRKIAGLRDILGHTYFQVEDQIIWDVV